MSSKKKSSQLSQVRTRAGRRLCTAKKNTCNAFAMADKDVCYHHGGKSDGTHSLKHGRFSKYVPAELLKAYQEYLADEKLADLGDDDALLTSFIAAELEGAKEGEPSLELWKTATGLYAKMMDGGPQREASAKELGSVLKAGQSKTEKIYRAAQLMDQRRKLVETKQKLELLSEKNLTIAQAMAFVMAVSAAVKTQIEKALADQAVKDKLQRAITFEIARLMRRSLDPGVDTGILGD